MFFKLKYCLIKNQSGNNQFPILEIPPLNFPVQQNIVEAEDRRGALCLKEIVKKLENYIIIERSYIF